MIVKLLTEHHLEFLSLKGGCRGSSESTLVKMSNFVENLMPRLIMIILPYLEARFELCYMESLRSHAYHMTLEIRTDSLDLVMLLAHITGLPNRLMLKPW